MDYNFFISNQHLFRNPCGESWLIKSHISKIAHESNRLICIDGGYCEGKWSNEILKYCRPQPWILGYEASFTTFTESSLKILGKVILENKGLSDKNEVVKVNPGRVNDNDYIVDPKFNNSEDLLDLEMVRLDTDIYKVLPDNFENLIVKLDIESYEFRAIQGMEGIMPKVRLIQWERHYNHKDLITSTLHEEVKYLENYGFNIYALGDGHLLQINGKYWDDGYDICNDTLDVPININNIPGKLSTPFRPKCINLVAVNENINI